MLGAFAVAETADLGGVAAPVLLNLNGKIQVDTAAENAF